MPVHFRQSSYSHLTECGIDYDKANVLVTNSNHAAVDCEQCRQSPNFQAFAPQEERTSAIVHYIEPVSGKPACRHDGTGSTTWTRDPGRVTCFACRKTETFKNEQLLRGVGMPTPLEQRRAPRSLRQIIAEDAPNLVNLQARANAATVDGPKNERGMYVIEEFIHHGEYRSVRRVEVYQINEQTVDAVLQSSAYCYGSWADPAGQYAKTRRPALLALVEDLRHGRTNRNIGWSTFRLITTKEQ